MPTPTKISASRAKTLTQCSMLYYLQEIEKIPQKVWARTNHGSVIHSVFEMVMDKTRARRQKWLKNIILNGFDIKDYPSISRYIKFYNANKGKLDPYTDEEMGEMLDVAFKGIRTYFLDKDGQNFLLPDYSNEERFEIDIGGGGRISGFIDLIIRLSPTTYKIIDLKSQKNKFKKDEMADNIQGLMYQLAIWEKYQATGDVEFILLRHKPTKQTPLKHIQVTPQVCKAQLNGLKLYFCHLYGIVNQFSLQDALTSPCCDSGFCRNVCTYFNEFQYQSLRKKENNALVRNFLLDDKVKVGDDEYIQILTSVACPVAKRY